MFDSFKKGKLKGLVNSYSCLEETVKENKTRANKKIRTK